MLSVLQLYEIPFDSQFHEILQLSKLQHRRHQLQPGCRHHHGLPQPWLPRYLFLIGTPAYELKAHPAGDSQIIDRNMPDCRSFVDETDCLP